MLGGKGEKLLFVILIITIYDQYSTVSRSLHMQQTGQETAAFDILYVLLRSNHFRATLMDHLPMSMQ